MRTKAIAREEKRTLFSRSTLLAVAVLVALVAGVVSAQVSTPAPEVRLYTLVWTFGKSPQMTQICADEHLLKRGLVCCGLGAFG